LALRRPVCIATFGTKEALEAAVAEEILTVVLGEFQTASAAADPDTRFRRIVDAYLRFAHERFALYAFVMQNRHPERS
jgi:hypothetical protein